MAGFISPRAAGDALRDRTITCGGLGKTFAITGWRLGYVIAPTRFARPSAPYTTT